MSATNTEERRLPTLEQVQLLQHLLGYFLSELEDVRQKCERAFQAPAWEDAEVTGEEVDPAVRADLVRLLVLTIDLARSADTIASDVRELQDVALSRLIVAERIDGPNARVEPDSWRAYQERIAEWHRGLAWEYGRDGQEEGDRG